MNTVTYIPSKDELLLKFCPLKGKKSKKSGNFILWYDKQGNICGIEIESYQKELKELTINFNVIKLDGIWEGIKITDKDIKQIRKELISKFEKKW